MTSVVLSFLPPFFWSLQKLAGKLGIRCATANASHGPTRNMQKAQAKNLLSEISVHLFRKCLAKLKLTRPFERQSMAKLLTTSEMDNQFHRR